MSVALLECNMFTPTLNSIIQCIHNYLTIVCCFVIVFTKIYCHHIDYALVFIKYMAQCHSLFNFWLPVYFIVCFDNIQCQSATIQYHVVSRSTTSRYRMSLSSAAC